MVTAPYPSTATYPPLLFPGTFSSYTSPAYSFSPAPTFPYAATYPHPPDLLSPPPTSSSPSFPFGPSHAPVYMPASTFPSSIPTQVGPNEPPPAATQIHGTLSHHHFPPTPVLTPLLHRPDQASGYSSAPATFSSPCSQVQMSMPPTPALQPVLGSSAAPA